MRAICRNRWLSLLALVPAILDILGPGTAVAQSIDPAEAVKLVVPLYRAITASAPTEIAQLLEQVTVPDWQNCTGENTCQDRAATIKRWIGRISIIPDYRLEQKEVLISGGRIIVRSEATGTPASLFLGISPRGRTFRIMTIDIHEVRDGKIVRSFHVEDWASATHQLSER